MVYSSMWNSPLTITHECGVEILHTVGVLNSERLKLNRQLHAVFGVYNTGYLHGG